MRQQLGTVVGDTAAGGRQRAEVGDLQAGTMPNTVKSSHIQCQPACGTIEPGLTAVGMGEQVIQLGQSRRPLQPVNQRPIKPRLLLHHRPCLPLRRHTIPGLAHAHNQPPHDRHT